MAYIDYIYCSECGSECDCNLVYDGRCDNKYYQPLICQSCLEKMQAKIKRYEKALRSIMQHQEIICKSACDLRLSATYNLARQALEEK